jgi:NADH:ubiquinone oxidoreductase subunit 6 (subunit J)
MTARDIVTGIIAVAACIPAWACVFVVWSSPWRETRVGRHLMAYMLSLAVTFTSLSVGIFTALPEWAEWVRLALYSGTVLTVWWRLVIMIKVRREPVVEPLKEPRTTP